MSVPRPKEAAAATMFPSPYSEQPPSSGRNDPRPKRGACSRRGDGRRSRQVRRSRPARRPASSRRFGDGPVGQDRKPGPDRPSRARIRQPPSIAADGQARRRRLPNQRAVYATCPRSPQRSSTSPRMGRSTSPGPRRGPSPVAFGSPAAHRLQSSTKPRPQHPRSRLTGTVRTDLGAILQVNTPRAVAVRGD